MRAREVKPYRHYRIDCASQGMRETWAKSPAQAISRVKWQLRSIGVYPITTYWGEPEEVKS